jgi:hypothetical protein
VVARHELGVDEVDRRHGIRLRGRTVDAQGPEVAFADGSRMAPTAVIWATGFAVDHSFVQVPVFDDAARLMHHRGVTAAPGLYFLGLTWQHTRGSALLGWVKDDAEFIVARIAAHAEGKPAAAVAQAATGERPPRGTSHERCWLCTSSTSATANAALEREPRRSCPLSTKRAHSHSLSLAMQCARPPRLTLTLLARTIHASAVGSRAADCFARAKRERGGAPARHGGLLSIRAAARR